MITFLEFWTLHAPMQEYQHMKRSCKKIWDALPPEKQQMVIENIREKKSKNQFVDFNPFYAIQKNTVSPHRTLQMSFDDYYKKYGTTADTDGWTKHFLPDEHRTIYVKTTLPSRDHLPITIQPK